MTGGGGGGGGGGGETENSTRMIEAFVANHPTQRQQSNDNPQLGMSQVKDERGEMITGAVDASGATSSVASSGGGALAELVTSESPQMDSGGTGGGGTHLATIAPAAVGIDASERQPLYDQVP